jgi:type II secretory pathway component PulK
MDPEKNKTILNRKCRPAVALVVTLVILVALSSVAYGLYARLAAQRHRDQYIIDYTTARYAADSGLKYTLTFIGTKNPKLISRPNVPDFSDLFHLSEEEYQQLLEEWVQILSEREIDEANDVNDITDLNGIININDITDVNDPNEAGSIEILEFFDDQVDPNFLTIPGPYGPPWPLITEEIKFEIGSAEVTIEIHDENAKMPLSWALMSDKDLQQQEADAALKTFCEWMEMDTSQTEELESQTKEIAEIKEFKFITKPKNKPDTASNTNSDGASKSNRRPPRRRRSRRHIKPATPKISDHIIDWVRLFHSPLLDTEALARPTIVSEKRQESALKYLGIWGSESINVNTAPRHVLEAAFTFGGDADKIAEEIIQKRRIKPFNNISELKTLLFSYADSITKAEKCITTKSDFFTIRVTARSGVAKISAIAAVTKDNKKVEKIAVIAE